MVNDNISGCFYCLARPWSWHSNTPYAMTTKPSSKLFIKFFTIVCHCGPTIVCIPIGGVPVVSECFIIWLNYSSADAVLSSQTSSLKPVSFSNFLASSGDIKKLFEESLAMVLDS